MTGIRSPKTSFWNHSQAGAFSTSPAQNIRSIRDRSCGAATCAPLRMSSRTAVGEVKPPVTLLAAAIR